MLFEEATQKVKLLKTKPDDNTLLKLYGLYKQATIGDCNISKPYFYQMEQLAKWNAWNDLKGKTTETAKKQYVDLVQKLINEN